MAGEEEVELRDLVAQSLETKGVLGKIRAQLRASVFLALEEHESEKKPHPLASTKLADFLKTKEGRLTTSLVREFLEFFELDYTCSVFDPESNSLEHYPGREKLASELGIEASPMSPLLAGLMHKPRHSPSSPSATKQLKLPQERTNSSNSTHVPSQNLLDDFQPPSLTTGKLAPFVENDTAHKNSVLNSHLPLTNTLNSNENSNLHQNGLESHLPPLVIHERGPLAESVTKNSVDVLLNTDPTDSLPVAKPESASRDELDEFFEHLETKNPTSEEQHSHISEELSSSIVTGKLETEDLTVSQSSLNDEFDYSEQVKS